MTWTAPRVERSWPRAGLDERRNLEAWLDFHRATLLLKCAGLTAEQLRLPALPPSRLSLLGLVRHLADVERHWFRRSAAGQELPSLYPDRSSFTVDGADAEADYATFGTEVAAARGAVAHLPLTLEYRSPGRPSIDLRWTYLHMLEEYARHNGHADLLREHIDGVTGD